MEEEPIRIRKPREGEVIGTVEAMLGANKLNVRCQDGKIRICRIPGRFKKRLWIRPGDAVLVEPWKIQGDSRGDVIWKYTKTQTSVLKKKNMLK